MPAQFVGKTAIVTAGASGIGAATATLLACEGAAVMIADISARRAAALAMELRQQGYTAQGWLFSPQRRLLLLRGPALW